MDYATIINGMKRFGSTEKEICFHGIGVPPEEIHKNVVLAPWWEPSSLPDLGKAEFLNESDYSAVKVRRRFCVLNGMDCCWPGKMGGAFPGIS